MTKPYFKRRRTDEETDESSILRSKIQMESYDRKHLKNDKVIVGKEKEEILTEMDLL